MKTTNLLLTALLSGSLLAGCIDLSSDDKAAAAEIAKGFLDDYQEGETQEVSTSDALEKDYIDTTEVVESNAVGNANIGGEIAADALNRSLAKISSRSIGSRAQLAARVVGTISPSDFTVSFINGKGKKVVLTIAASSILIHQPPTGNPQFIIEGMGDGINYIVEVNLTVDGASVNLKSVAFVPPGETRSERAIIDPVSTVIAKAVQDKVVNGFFETGGDSFSQTYISDLAETMTAVIKAVIVRGDFTLAQFEEAIANDAGVNGLVTKVLSNKEVNAGLNKLEDAAVADTFAVPETVAAGDEGQAEARTIVQELFNKDDEEGGGAPKFLIDFFGDQYQQGALRTVDEIITAIFSGVDIKASTSVDVTQFTKAGALNAFTTELFDIYGAIDTVDTLEKKESLSEAEEVELQLLREELSRFNLLLGIFPPEKKAEWQALTGASSLRVPQAISLIFYVLDTYLEDLKGFERNDAGQLEETDGVDFEPNNLLELYGFDTNNTQQQAAYANLEANWLELHPSQIWLASANEGNGGQIDVLQIFTCVDAYPESLFDIKSVSLTFTKKDGSASDPMPLKIQSDNNNGNTGTEGPDSKNTCYTINPWAESEALANSGNPKYGSESQGLNYDAIWQDLVDSGSVVTNFGSGEYTLNVVYSKDAAADTTSTFTFNKRIITGLSNLYPRFTSPLGLPNAPEGNASPAEWEAFNTAQNDFSMTNWATADLAEFKWAEPVLLATTPLPEGVIAVYNMDIGRDICGDDPTTTNVVEDYCRWQHVFSSRETGSQIFDTSFVLPVETQAALTPLGLTDTPYQANLSINFIDEDTGQVLGSGGHASAPFRIGELLDLDQPFTLSGSVSGAPHANFFPADSNVAFPITAYKVAAVKESCNEDKTAEPFVETFFDEAAGEFVTVEYFPWICTSETLAISALTASDTGHTYSLMPDVSAMMGNSNNSWIDIRMFIDANNDGVINQGTPANNFFGEPQFWSQGGNVNFNTWGGVLRISSHGECNDNGCDFSEEIVIPGETYEGPNFDAAGNAPGGDGSNGGGDDGFKNINAFFSNAAGTFLGTTLEWDLDPSINVADIAGFRVLLFEVSPGDKGPEPKAVRVIDAAGSTLRSITIDQMLNAGTGLADITDTAITHINEDIAAEGGTAVVALTTGTLTNDKAYVWFVEAYGAGEGVDIGESNDVFIAPAPPQ
jgi:hypothetical protein